MANLEFLGFQIGSDGVKISRKKLEILEKLPAPGFTEDSGNVHLLETLYQGLP